MRSLSIFRSAFNNVKNRYSVVTITGLVLIIGVLGYYYYFLVVRSANLDQRQYRALSRIEDQLKTNVDGYKGLAVGQVRAALANIEEGNSKINVSDLDLLCDNVDIANRMLSEELAKVGFLRDAKANRKALLVTHATLGRKQYDEMSGPVSLAKHSAVDSLISIHVDYPWKIDEDHKYVIGVDYTLSLKNAITPLLRYDLYDEYAILFNDSIVFSTTSIGLSTIEFDTLNGDIDNNPTGDGVAKRVAFNGFDYRAYQVGFSVDAETGWSIVGVRSAERFANERRTIPRAFLFGVFILAIFIVLSLPFIKSMIMSRTERLGTLDVIFTAVSLALATSVISILLLNGYLRVDVDQVEQEQQLDALSRLVENHLCAEVDSIATELIAYADFNIRHDELVKTLDSLKATEYDRYSLINDSIKLRSTLQYDSVVYLDLESEIDSDYASATYGGFNNMFLVRNGNTCNDVHESSLNFDVSNRDYVSDWRNGGCMMMSNVRVPVILDAIISWREQEFRGVVSVKPDSSVYEACAMTMLLRSLSHPIIPDKTGFCIFDSKGNVQFHSEAARCLKENIFEECEYDPELIALVTGRAADHLEVEYSGSPQKMYVKPLAQMPYFIATYSELAPVDAIHGQVFGAAFILQALLFSFYIVIVLFGVFVVRRTSRLQNPVLDISIFSPDIDGTERYVGAIFFNILFGIILLISAGLIQGSLTIFFLFFISAPYIILLNILLLSRYTFADVLRKTQRKLFYVIVATVVVVNFVAGYYASSKWIIPLIQFCALLIYFVIENRIYSCAIGGYFDKLVAKLDYKRAYNRVVFILVLMTCVLPAMFFSIHTYNKEKEIAVKTLQLQLLNKFTASGYLETVDKDHYLRLSDYKSAFYETHHNQVDSAMCSSEKSAYDYDIFSSGIRQMVQNAGQEYNRLGFGASDSLWRWCYLEDESLALVGKSLSPCKPDYHYGMISRVPFFELPLFFNAPPGRTIRFWLALSGALIGLYIILKLFTQKVFIHEKYSRSRSLEYDQDFLCTADSGYKAFVTGMPSAGKSAYFLNKTKDQPNLHVLDFIKHKQHSWSFIMDAALRPGPGTVLLDHFEHDIFDKDVTMAKLEIIEQLVAMKDKRVIIVSSIQPGVFTNRLETESENKSEQAESQRMFERWNRVLAAFYTFNFRLQGYENDHLSISKEYMQLMDIKRLNIPDKLVQLIESECDNGVFLRTIGLELIDELHKRDSVNLKMDDDDKWIEREDLIIRTQKLADTYYRSLWNHLAIEEQFVLHDMAQDGLVNAKNNDIVEALIDKGIIIYTTRLRIMNRSFRNFILTVVGPTDLGKLDIEMRSAGAWSKLKPALLLVVVSLFLFVIKSDRTQLFGYFTAFAAIIPVVVGLVSRFSNVGKKE